MPETEMRDSWEAWRRSVGRIAVIGETRSNGSNSSGEATMAEGVAVDSDDSSFSSGIAAWGSGCRWGESSKMSSRKEFAGLTADTKVVAGLLLIVSAIGVLTLRIVGRPGGMRPRDFRLRCLLALCFATSRVPEFRRSTGGMASSSEL